MNTVAEIHLGVMQSVEQFVENTFLVKLYEHTFASFEGCVTSWLGKLTIACRL